MLSHTYFLYIGIALIVEILPVSIPAAPVSPRHHVARVCVYVFSLVHGLGRAGRRGAQADAQTLPPPPLFMTAQPPDYHTLTSPAPSTAGSYENADREEFAWVISYDSLQLRSVWTGGDRGISSDHDHSRSM